MDEPWLKSNVRPLVTLIAFLTISGVILFKTPDDWLLRQYVTWTGVFVTFYFGWRSVESFIKRKK